jgi:hypothetical protein
MLDRLRPAAVRIASAIAVGIALAAVLLPLALRLPNVLIPDDGYFYAQIAYNLGLYGRSTFDGVHPTNGYHLPWALVLAAASRGIGVFSHDKTIHLFAHLAIALSLAVATVRRYFSRPLVRACAIVVLVSSFSLTEMILAAPLLLELLRRLTTAEGDPPRRRSTAALVVVLVLVRVDLALAPVAAAASLATSEPRRAARLAAAALVGIALSVAMTKAASGHFVSVAAWIKAGVTLQGVPALLRLNLAPSAFVALTLAAQGVLAAIALALRPTRVTGTLLAASLAFLVLHTCVNVLRGWYLVPSWLGLLFTIEQAMAGAPLIDRSRARAARAALALVTFGFLLHAVRAEIVYAEDQRIAASFVSRLPELVPRGARIFTYDNPGFLGFFSGYDVVDGDGLVNDFDYARRLMSGHLEGYLEEEQLCHVVVPDAEARPILDLSGLVVRSEDVIPLVVLRRHVESQADFALYRLKTARCAALRSASE